MNDLETLPLPAGTFVMGSGESHPRQGESDGPPHEVTVSAFECMLYPVTRRLYAAVTGQDPALAWFEFAARTGRSVAGWSGEPDATPVIWVRWLQAIEFCNALSRRKGVSPCYAISGTANAVASRDAKVEWNRATDGYRLPTEAEWEYACRAGTTTRWSHGNDESELGRYAWYRDNADGRPHPVGRKRPNPWGLFDMHGNVQEWCYDGPREYGAQAAADPVGDGVTIYRALRGGCCTTEAFWTRSAARHSLVRTKPYFVLGFRCVRSASRSPR